MINNIEECNKKLNKKGFIFTLVLHILQFFLSFYEYIYTYVRVLILNYSIQIILNLLFTLSSFYYFYYYNRKIERGREREKKTLYKYIVIKIINILKRILLKEKFTFVCEREKKIREKNSN